MTQPTVRILLGGASSLGPGKAALLEEIDHQGSISAAARAMGMSYRRAWLLVEAMNRGFREPLVTTATGGRRGGGAALTDFGREVLRRYRAMEAKAQKAIEADLERFRALLCKAS
ncbi:winged helix-turn-helix domain-containing protein [Thiobacter aerophilum]|uniref:LysR family transcriptional regulator n=1 Tax=Thiobacter aerophilum TaxID=3121275 RepID=A0ABV0EAW5_9BURK